MLIDLQIHSTYSDGYLTPAQAADYLVRQGVKVAALTDHNTVGGLHEFKTACEKKGIRAVPGLELYASLGGKKFNLLWYNLDYQAPELHDMLRDSQKRRRKIFRSALERLAGRGFRLDINRILDRCSHYVSLNHVIDDILADKRNYAKIKKELGLKIVREENVINAYLQNKRVGKLRNSYLDIVRILRLRKRLGGQLVLCHPAKHHYLKENFLSKLTDLGIDGIEVLSPHHSYGAVMHIQALAREYGLVESGGSDFHRPEGSREPVQSAWDYFRIDSKLLRGVEKIIG